MRPHGSRNAGYQQRRTALLDQLIPRLTQRDAGRPTLRQLAAAAGCSVSTLTHYFSGRDAIIAAAFDRIAEGTTGQLEALRQTEGAFAASVHGAAARTTDALYDPAISTLLAMGLIESLSVRALGPPFLGTMLDPFVNALAERLATHVAQGEMRPTDTRMAAMSLISPILIGALHQCELGGLACNPLDAAAHARHVADSFVAAHGTGAPEGAFADQSGLRGVAGVDGRPDARV